MSTGEFALHLQQSVHEHLETIARMASDAKARIAVEPGAVTVPPPVPLVAFHDDPAFLAATSRTPAVSFDELLAGGRTDDAAPVWEEPP